jgi:putative flippase GtrA
MTWVREIGAGELVRFCLVGAVGFVIDAGTLHALLALSHVGPYRGRVASYAIAATATWAMNRSFTFRRARVARRSSEWARYLAVNAVGGGVSYAVYATCIAAWAAARAWPALGVAAGSLAGLAVNFLASKHLVFGAAGETRRTSSARVPGCSASARSPSSSSSQ